MKRNIFFIGIILIFSSQHLCANDETLPRFYHESVDEYTAEGINQISISNQHGNITFSGWEKDTIIVKASIWVEAPFSTAANEIHDQITSRKNIGEGIIHVQTIFDNNFFSNYTFGINYHIQAPKDLQLELNNRFGDIEIDHFSGNANINLDYGNFSSKQNSRIRSGEISVSNGNISIDKLVQSSITHNNGILKLGMADSIELNTDFSNIIVDFANSIVLKSQTGNINIKGVKSINGKSDFSYININKLKNDGFLELSGGELNINMVSTTLEDVTITSEKAPINLGIPSGLSYTLHGQVVDGSLIHPKQENITLIREINTISFSGSFIDSGQTSASLILFVNKSNLQIMEAFEEQVNMPEIY